MSLYKHIIRHHDQWRKDAERKFARLSTLGKAADEKQTYFRFYSEMLLKRDSEAFKALLKTQGHFFLDKETCNQLVHLAEIRDQEHFKELQPFIKSPFPICWLEIEAGSSAYGLLVEERATPWSIKLTRFAKNEKGSYLLSPDSIVINDMGVDTRAIIDPTSDYQNRQDHANNLEIARVVCSLLLAMNSRGAPIKFGDDESITLIEKQKKAVAEGTSPVANNRNGRYKVHRIVFDPSRLMKSAHLSNPLAEKSLKELHDVVGHWVKRFNNRTQEYTLYWRNAHKRGGTPEQRAEASLPANQYIVRPPSRPLTTPDKLLESLDFI